jgi:hypothetical protein
VEEVKIDKRVEFWELLYIIRGLNLKLPIKTLLYKIYAELFTEYSRE